MRLSLEDCLPPKPITTEHLENILEGLIEYEPLLFKVPSEPLDHITHFRQQDMFMELRKSVRAWGSVWGGVDNWNYSIDILFGEALGEGYRDSHDIVVSIFRLSQRGKRLLAGLDDLHGKLPTDNLAVALLWRYHDELVKILVKGITILDCRLDHIERSLNDTDVLGRLDYRIVLGELTRTNSD